MSVIVAMRVSMTFIWPSTIIFLFIFLSLIVNIGVRQVATVRVFRQLQIVVNLVVFQRNPVPGQNISIFSDQNVVVIFLLCLRHVAL